VRETAAVLGSERDANGLQAALDGPHKEVVKKFI
jgi:hypothetical protein